MSRWPKNTFSSTKVPKQTIAKHISTKVSFNITLQYKHVYIWHTFTLNMKQVEKMIVLKW